MMTGSGLGSRDGRQQKLEVRRVERRRRATALLRPIKDGTHGSEHTGPYFLRYGVLQGAFHRRSSSSSMRAMNIWKPACS